MTEFYNPYQFIEFTGKVNDENVKITLFSEINKGNTEARHDYWLPSEDYHSGRILCQIHLLSPTITGNTHDKKRKTPSTIVEQYKYKEQPAIQANSLRGMIGNIIETLSQSALRILSDKNYRVSDNKKTHNFSHSTFDFFKAATNADTNADTKKNYHNALPWGNDRKDLTPAEILLGAVNSDSENLASRIHFSDALGENIKLDGNLIPLKILGSPKPSESGSKQDKNKGTPTACMYFKPRNGSGYIAKTELNETSHEANGRKFYLPHPATATPHWKAKIDGEDNNAKQRIYCQPLARKQTLYFHIDFNNLSTDELVLLQTSLKPSQNSIGLGKPLGLGQINLTVLATFFIDRRQRYGLQALNTERYSKVQSTEANLPDYLKTRYPHEYQAIAAAPKTDAPKTELAATSALIDKNTLTLMQLLGNPKKQKQGIAICFPYDEDKGQKPYIEKESFKWFVANNTQDKDKAQYLQTLNKAQAIPTLNSSHKRHAEKLKQKTAPTTTEAKLIIGNLPVYTEQEKPAIEQEIRSHFTRYKIITLHLPDEADSQAYIEIARNDLDDFYNEANKHPLFINNNRISFFRNRQP